MFYKLIGRLPVPMADAVSEEFAKWFEATDRHIARTVVGPIEVSTVFLGIDHNYSRDPESPPLLFETMIFGGSDGDAVYDRYSTWDDAEKGHAKAVEIARRTLANLDMKGCQ